MDGIPGAQTVLVAGATGMLGSKIAAELLRLPGVTVRLLARPETQDDPRKRGVLDPLVSAGAKITPGSLAAWPTCRPWRRRPPAPMWSCRPCRAAGT